MQIFSACRFYSTYSSHQHLSDGFANVLHRYHETMVAVKPESRYTHDSNRVLEAERREPDISHGPANENNAEKANQTETVGQRYPVRNCAAVLREYGGVCGGSKPGSGSETGTDGDRAGAGYRKCFRRRRL